MSCTTGASVEWPSPSPVVLEVISAHRRLDVPVRMGSTSAYAHTLTPWAPAPAPTPVPDVLVDDELPCPVAPWLLSGGLPGAKVLRHLNGCGYWACCPGALVALWSVFPPRPVCAGCVAAGCAYCSPVTESCQSTRRGNTGAHPPSFAEFGAL
jgi:hypothetical protein